MRRLTRCVWVKFVKWWRGYPPRPITRVHVGWRSRVAMWVERWWWGVKPMPTWMDTANCHIYNAMLKSEMPIVKENRFRFATYVICGLMIVQMWVLIVQCLLLWLQIKGLS